MNFGGMEQRVSMLDTRWWTRRTVEVSRVVAAMIADLARNLTSIFIVEMGWHKLMEMTARACTQGLFVEIS
jgi:hypothetical protein